MTTVTIDALDQTRHRVTFRYDPELVSLIKASVPHYARGWDPGAKHWMVDNDQVDFLVEALTEAGHDVDRYRPVGSDGAGSSPFQAEADAEGSDPGRPPTLPDVESFFDGSDGFDVIGAAINALDKIPAQHQHAVFRQMGKILMPELFKAPR